MQSLPSKRRRWVGRANSVGDALSPMGSSNNLGISGASMSMMDMMNWLES